MNLAKRTNSSHLLAEVAIDADSTHEFAGLIPVTATPATAVAVGAGVAAAGTVAGAAAAGAAIGEAID